MKVSVYDMKGKESSKIDLPDELFGLPENNDLVHQVMVSMNSNKRAVIAHTKGRGDVRGGGKKPHAQKGTGKARAGSSRSPIWRGGGVTFGPTSERNFSKKINKKMRNKALLTILSAKARDGKIVLMDELKLDAPKTAGAKDVLAALSKNDSFSDILSKRKNSAFIAMGERDENTEKSFSNFSNIKMDELRKLNVLDLLNTKYLVLPNAESAVEFLKTKLN